MSTNELKHYGVLGTKWGVRRYQNKNGSLTEAGKERYGKFKKKIRNFITDDPDDPNNIIGGKKVNKYEFIGGAIGISLAIGYTWYKNSRNAVWNTMADNLDFDGAKEYSNFVYKQIMDGALSDASMSELKRAVKTFM